MVVTSFNTGQGGSYTLTVSGLNSCSSATPTQPPSGCATYTAEEANLFGVRPPRPGELVEMSKAPANPEWGMPAPPNASLVAPLGKVVASSPGPRPERPQLETPSGAQPQSPNSVSVGAGSTDFMWKTYSSGQTGGTAQKFYDIGAAAWLGPYCNQNGGTIAQSPAILQYQGQFQVVALGTDGQIYQAYYNPPPDNRWYGWFRLSVPSPYSSGFTSAPAVTSYRGQFHVFARAADSTIMHAWYDWGTRQWFGWVRLTYPNGAYVYSASAPSITTYTGNVDRHELHVFYVNSNSSRDLMQMVFNAGSNNAWTGPTILTQGPWHSAPAVTQYLNQLQVWAVVNETLVYAYYVPGSGWFGFYGSGWSAGSAPAISQYNNQLQVFYVESSPAGNWNGRQRFYHPGSGWLDGGRFSNSMSSAPAITTFGSQFQVWWRNGSNP